MKINDETEAKAGTDRAHLLGYSRRAQAEKKFFEDCCAAWVFPSRGLEHTSPAVQSHVETSTELIKGWNPIYLCL